MTCIASEDLQLGLALTPWGCRGHAFGAGPVLFVPPPPARKTGVCPVCVLSSPKILQPCFLHVDADQKVLFLAAGYSCASRVSNQFGAFVVALTLSLFTFVLGASVAFLLARSILPPSCTRKFFRHFAVLDGERSTPLQFLLLFFSQRAQDGQDLPSVDFATCGRFCELRFFSARKAAVPERVTLTGLAGTLREHCSGPSLGLPTPCCGAIERPMSSGRGRGRLWPPMLPERAFLTRPAGGWGGSHWRSARERVR